MVEYEYEYLPPNEGVRPYESSLPSAFDAKATPAGMRGEAVRSAIRSGRCICWDLSSSELAQGWIKVEGKGVWDFFNNKFTRTFGTVAEPSFQEACLLNAKGRVVDQVGVASLSSTCAYILTSPGHSGKSLFDRLDPLIFPMDEVRLTECSQSAMILTLASTQIRHAQTAIEDYILPLLKTKTAFVFPKNTQDHDCFHVELASGSLVTFLPTAILPETAASGYTIVLENLGDEKDNLGKAIWHNLVSEQSPEGPIEIGPLEFETLRIEAGMPRFGVELTGGDKKNAGTAANPLELFLDRLVDQEKGCYLGQEGVASVSKNPRGPPRLLYQVVFEHMDNCFQTESQGDKGNVENLTEMPQEGSTLHVLGSNNEISVGKLTSIAEPSSTGDQNILGLALIRRADSILKAMQDRGLEIDRNSGGDPFEEDPLWNGGSAQASAIVQPPPIDPLSGLEVIIEGTYTVGVLKSIASRRYPMGQNMFTDIVSYGDVEPAEGEVEINRVERRWPPNIEAALDAAIEKQQASRSANSEPSSQGLDDTEVWNEAAQDEIDAATKEAEKAQAIAEAAAAEAERKSAKMAMLKKRADEALARRKSKKKKEDS